MKAVHLLLLLSFSVVSIPSVTGRQLLSDGGNPVSFKEINPISFIWGINFNGHGEGKTCEEVFGFIPCSKTMMGHLFLILVYEYLLFHAESYVASGGERIFQILGPGVFGASVFQIIGSLPEALILLASGLSSSNEVAEECVITGIGLLAGSSILLLTILWGTCVTLASHPLPENDPLSQQGNCGRLKKWFFSLWPGLGTVTDIETSYTARIMLISVIPLALIQFPQILKLSPFRERVFILISLVVSLLFLLSYFLYQFFQPWIQRRRLLYIKHEHLVLDILRHFQNETMGQLLTETGSPSATAIKRLFEERDRDGDKVINISELKEFLNEIEFRRIHEDKDSIIAQLTAEFDADNDQKITTDEFVGVMRKWLAEVKQGMDRRYHSVKSLKDMYQFLKPWIQKQKAEHELMKRLMPNIVEHIQKSSLYGSLVLEDGTPDIPAIKRLFKSIDLDEDNCISTSELKTLLRKINFNTFEYNEDLCTSTIIHALDLNGDQIIDEEEFIRGLSEFLNTMNYDSQLEEDHSTWEQIDKLAEDKLRENSVIAWTKAILLSVVGISMLGILAEPLSKSVRDFSKAANIPSFYIAFILVPVATNARISVSAISEARRKKLTTISLTLSEIYGTVFMNNILGLFVLLSLVYFRGISWNFSSDILVVLLVTAIAGCITSFITIFTVWTSIFAYLLYPLSLLLVYALTDFEGMIVPHQQQI